MLKLKFLTLLLILLLPSIILGLSSSPGAQVRLNSAGISKSVQSLVKFLDEAFGDETVSDVSGSHGKIKYDISNIKFHVNVDPTKTLFKTNTDNSLSLTTGAVSAKINFHYHLKIHEIIHISKSGNCDASIDGSSFTITLKIDSKNGIPQISLINDQVSIKDLKYKCHGDLIDDLLDLLHKFITPTITKHLNEYIDKIIKEKLPEISSKISNIKMIHELNGKLKNFYVDYELSGNPKLSREQLIIPIISQFYYQGHKNDNPSTVYPSKNPFPSTSSKELFCINIDTNLVFKSMIYSFNMSDINTFYVNKNILQKLNKNSQEFFSCSCNNGDKCLIKLLPELQQHCLKDETFDIKGKIHIGGDLSSNSSGLIANANGSGDFTVGSLTTTLLTIDVDIGVLIKKNIRVQNWTLYGDIDIYETKLSANSILGPIAPHILQQIWEFGLQDVAQFIANEFLEDGIPLPKLDFMTFNNVQIQFDGPLIQVCSDMEIDFSHLI